MELTLEHAYDAGLDHVISHFFSEDHILAKNEKLGARNVKVIAIQKDDVAGKLVVEREMTASTEVPGMLASFHREWNEIRQEEHWVKKDDSEWHCEFRVKVEGVPAKIKGVMRVQGNGDRCINYINLTVKSEVPFLGKKIAGFLANDTRIKIDQEREAIASLL
ncbi:DUF2505 domain-containing protein [Marinobacter sp.]|uniref:DUF2505 domain-containing protein n=1 Tax=Marinobacter sp. TaxID=50741 RepID=UPI002B26EFB1|nr:DUF2505 domain-containing protein [Marinobacter sp.]